MFHLSEKLKTRPYHKTEFRKPEDGGLLDLWIRYWEVHDPRVLESGVTDTCSMNKLAIKVGWHWFTTHPVGGKSFTPLMITLWILILSPLPWLFWFSPEMMSRLATLAICVFGAGFMVNAAYDASPKRFLNLMNVMFSPILAPLETLILAINTIVEADRRRFVRHILGWPILTLMLLYVFNQEAFWVWGKALLITVGLMAALLLIIAGFFIGVALINMWREERAAKKYNARVRAMSLSDEDLWPIDEKPAKKKGTSFQLLRALWHAIKMQACTKVEFEPVKVDDRFDD